MFVARYFFIAVSLALFAYVLSASVAPPATTESDIPTDGGASDPPVGGASDPPIVDDGTTVFDNSTDSGDGGGDGDDGGCETGCIAGVSILTIAIAVVVVLVILQCCCGGICCCCKAVSPI